MAQRGNALDVIGLGEHVDRLGIDQFEAALHKLPRVAGGEPTPEHKLAARLERELNIVHATQKEMESLGSA